MTAAVEAVAVEDERPCGCLSAPEVLTLAGGALTYRQLDYWCRRGIIRAHRHRQTGRQRTLGNATTDTGSGIGRGFDKAAADKAARIAQASVAFRAVLDVPDEPIAGDLLAALLDGPVTVDNPHGPGRFVLTLQEQP
jgi:hypothetical protein